jgi:hypothetical protein
MTFILDVVQDLREKRLWPVAAGLLVALVAVPLLLAKPASEESESAPEQSTPGPVAQLPAVSLNAEAGKGSRLDIFNSRDPFDPVLDLPASSGGDEGGTGEGAGGGPASDPFSGADPASGAATTETDSGGSAGGDSGGGSDSGSGGSGGGGDGGGGGGGGGGGETKTTLYTYTVDVKYGRKGSEKTYKGVQQLQILPSDDNPHLVFLGVTTDGKQAVFMVDQSFTVTGEATCKPSSRTCTFLYAELDEDRDEATLTDPDGKEYRFRLVDIDRVKVAEAEKRAEAKSERARKRSKRSKPSGFGLKFFPVFLSGEAETR